MTFVRDRRPARRVREVTVAAIGAAMLLVALCLPALGAAPPPGPTKLLDPVITPSAADSATPVTFQVTYRNAHDLPPDYVRVAVGNRTYAMTGSGSDWKAGVVFTVTTKVPAGVADVRFQARDAERFVDELVVGTITIEAAPPPPSPAPTPTPAPTDPPDATPAPGGSSGGGPSGGGGSSGGGTGGNGGGDGTTDGSTPGGSTAGGSGVVAPNASGSPDDRDAGGGVAAGGSGGSGTDTGSGGSGGTGDPDSPTGAGAGDSVAAPTRYRPPFLEGISGSVGERFDHANGLGGGPDGSGTSGAPSSSTDGGASSGSGGPGTLRGPAAFLQSSFDAGLAALGLSGSGQLPTLPAIVGPTIMVTTWMAFTLFNKRRRDGEPPASDDVLQAAASTGVGLGSAFATALAPLDPEALMPRWRRPSLLEARKTDPIRSPGPERPRLTFAAASTSSASGAERRAIRYAVIPLLDRPDEILASRIGELVAGDEVEVQQRSGAYCHVICPDGRQGWIHRTTLGDVVEARHDERGYAQAPVSEVEPENALAAMLAARGLR